MKSLKFKSNNQLKLNIEVDEKSEDEERFENGNFEKEVSFNRGLTLKSDSICHNLTESVKNFLESPCWNYDLSFHWLETIDKAKLYSIPIVVCFSRVISIPSRDVSSEFEILKLITEDSHHKVNLIEIPKGLKKLNRYSDIIPCKRLIVMFRSF